MTKPLKRQVGIVVISDVHLGTHGSRAVELLDYLRSIRPRVLVLNGDIIDIWAFNKSRFPLEHMSVVKRIMKMAERIPVYYITGNHDEALRRYAPARLGNLRLVDELILNVDGRTHWFFHGDIFDATMGRAKWIAKLGSVGYDLLIRINQLVNWTLQLLGKPRMSFSARIKKSVKQAVSFISDFEQTMAEIAIDKERHTVVCGHIHLPQMRMITTPKGSVRYLNSGDWVESLSALEYANGEWTIYTHGHEPVRMGANGVQAHPFALAT